MHSNTSDERITMKPLFCNHLSKGMLGESIAVVLVRDGSGSIWIRHEELSRI